MEREAYCTDPCYYIKHKEKPESEEIHRQWHIAYARLKSLALTLPIKGKR